jgi:PTH1 family peptidyl-tRNA hydrolase
MKIIVGLGNPDSKYQGARHNTGFMAVEQLAGELNLTWNFDKSFNAWLAKSADYYLVKPATYMNNSGEAVQKILSYYKLTPADLIVIHDDLDIALGAYKIVTGGSSGGHYGVQSIIEHLKTPNFTRVRLGIATPILDKARKSIFPGAVGRFVLKRFPKDELPLLNETIAKVLKTIA